MKIEEKIVCGLWSAVGSRRAMRSNSNTHTHSHKKWLEIKKLFRCLCATRHICRQCEEFSSEKNKNFSLCLVNETTHFLAHSRWDYFVALASPFIALTYFTLHYRRRHRTPSLSSSVLASATLFFCSFLFAAMLRWLPPTSSDAIELCKRFFCQLLSHGLISTRPKSDLQCKMWSAPKLRRNEQKKGRK